MHINLILIFVGLFTFLYNGLIKNYFVLFLFNYGSALLGFVFWVSLDMVLAPSPSSKVTDSHYNFLKDFKRAFLFFFILLGYNWFSLPYLGLSPILKTLTEDTSCDTIWAFSTFFFLVNVGFHDYSFINEKYYIKKYI